MGHRQLRNWLLLSGLLAGCGGLLVAAAPLAEARITSLTNCATASPYGSTSFGSVGTYVPF